MSNFTRVKVESSFKVSDKNELRPTFHTCSLGPQESSFKVSDQLDTRLNNYGLISSQSMLIYHLKLKSGISRKRLLESQK